MPDAQQTATFELFHHLSAERCPEGSSATRYTWFRGSEEFHAVFHCMGVTLTHVVDSSTGQCTIQGYTSEASLRRGWKRLAKRVGVSE